MASKSKRNRQRRKRKEALLAAPDVAVTVAVSAPDKEKKMGGGMMVPPEREEMNDGGLPTPMQIGQQKFQIKMEEEIKRYEELKDLEDKYIQEKDEEKLKNVRLDLENYKGSIAEETYINKIRREAREQKAEGGKFPDLTGDGKVTQADVL